VYFTYVYLISNISNLESAETELTSCRDHDASVAHLLSQVQRELQSERTQSAALTQKLAHANERAKMADTIGEQIETINKK
jgi:hypothetical protein